MRYSEPNTYGLNVTPIHERCIHSGRCGAGDYSGVVRAPSKDIVEKWCEALKRDFHPAGYGTRTEVRKGLKSDNWYASYSRQGSCG